MLLLLAGCLRAEAVPAARRVQPSPLAPAEAEEVPAGSETVRFPIRLDSKQMAPEGSRAADGSLASLTAYIKEGRMLSSRRAQVRLRVDGIAVSVEFAVRSIEHPERTLGYVGTTHAYEMKLLRFQHGYRRNEKDGAYSWDVDSDDPHARPEALDPAKGRELDAFLQRGIELWVDRALSLILLSLEADFQNHIRTGSKMQDSRVK